MRFRSLPKTQKLKPLYLTLLSCWKQVWNTTCACVIPSRISVTVWSTNTNTLLNLEENQAVDFGHWQGWVLHSGLASCPGSHKVHNLQLSCKTEEQSQPRIKIKGPWGPATLGSADTVDVQSGSFMSFFHCLLQPGAEVEPNDKQGGEWVRNLGFPLDSQNPKPSPAGRDVPIILQSGALNSSGLLPKPHQLR